MVLGCILTPYKSCTQCNDMQYYKDTHYFDLHLHCRVIPVSILAPFKISTCAMKCALLMVSILTCEDFLEA